VTVLDLLRWLGETSLAVSALVLLVLIIRKPFARAFGARAAYALWLAPAVRLFLPELKVLPAPEATIFTPVYEFHEAGLAVAASAAPAFDWASLAGAAALVLWATVAFAWFSFRLEAQARYLRERLQNSEPASAALEDQARAIARQLGLRRKPRLRVSKDDASGPCVVGLIRPVVFLPASFEQNYAAAEQRLALAHELAHVVRGDMAATLAASALQAAQWPNPLAHLSFGAFRTDQEAACDAYVLARCANGAGAAGDYAAAIVKSVRAGTKQSPAYGLALAHPVKERLMLLKSPKKGRARLLAGAAVAAIFTATSLAATASYGFADEKTEKQETVVKEKHKKVWVVTADGDETMQIDGVKAVNKIEINEENGDRTVRIYGEDGKLISENVYGPEDDLPFKTVKFMGENGEEREIRVAQALNGSNFVFNGDFGLPADGTKRVMAFSTVRGADGAPHGVHMAECAGPGSGEGDVMMYEFKTEDGEDDQTFVTRDVVCLSGEDADPEKRAEALRKIIPIMEENAKKDAERRKEHIAQMKEELKKAEQEAKKN
jgi:beta-lactamase regulating signal transducer with metallopeptidase domain